MGIFSVTMSKNNDSMKTMQRLEQSYSKDSQTKSNESIHESEGQSTPNNRQ